MSEYTHIDTKKVCKRENLYCVYFSNGQSVLATEQTVYSDYIFVNKPLNEEQISTKSASDLEETVTKRVIDYISKSPRSQKEIELYIDKVLSQKYKLYYSNFFWKLINTEQIKANCIKKAKELGLIDDTQYAKDFLIDRINFKPRSKKAALFELQKKGINIDLAKQSLDDVNFDDEKMIKDILIKKTGQDKITQDPYSKSGQKLIRSLLQKGFDYELISKFIQK
jgi:SOS response regulatory protein OraA/RecX